MRKSFKIRDHFIALLFLKYSENLKSLNIGLGEVEAKRSLNGVRKCDGQTDTHTNIVTYRKIWPRGRIPANKAKFAEKLFFVRAAILHPL